MWHVTWTSQAANRSVQAIFVKLTDEGKYYDAWYGKLVITGYMNMTTTETSFEGQTYAQSNNDSCAVHGSINGSQANGNFNCASGDYGTVTAHNYGWKKANIH